MRTRLPLLLLIPSLLLPPGGCAPEAPFPGGDTAGCTLTLSVEGDAPSGGTRSVLPGTDAFERMVSGVTVMAYTAAGILETAGYYTAGSFTLPLSRGTGHTLYLFANMGDLRGSAPADEALVGEVSFAIPSYDSLSERGLPMAGRTVLPAGAGSTTVSLRRLMAKVVLGVDHTSLSTGGDEAPFLRGTLRLRGAARLLRPFAPGGSRARSAEELFEGGTDWADLSGDAFSSPAGEALLYVPENRQGILLSEGAGPLDKSLSNSALSSREAAALCTYLEFTGEKVGTRDGVSGFLTYRFFPGADPARNFDLEGGKRYGITLVLSWDGMFIEGNWMVERDEWSDSRRILVSGSPDGGWAGELSLTLPPGVQDHPFYVFYSPSGASYSMTPANGSYPHATYGWTFTFDGREGSASSALITAADGIQAGFAAHASAYSVHQISIPPDEDLCGESRELIYHTLDGRHRARVRVDIVEPEIVISPASVTRLWNEYGPDTAFAVRVTGGNVPLREITVTGSGGALQLGPFNPDTGEVSAWWTTSNTASTSRTGRILFSGLGASATCTVFQGARSSLVVNDDSDEGEANNTYD